MSGIIMPNRWDSTAPAEGAETRPCDHPFGDSAGYEQIYTLLKHAALRQGVTAADASELAQEATCRMFVLFRKLGTVTFESEEKRRSWARVVFGFVMSRYWANRNRQPARLADDAELVDTGMGLTTVFTRKAIQDTLAAAIRRLEPKHREIVLLKLELEEKGTWAELGRRLGLTDNGARKRFDAAADRLRTLLGPEVDMGEAGQHGAR